MADPNAVEFCLACETRGEKLSIRATANIDALLQAPTLLERTLAEMGLRLGEVLRTYPIPPLRCPKCSSRNVRARQIWEGESLRATVLDCLDCEPLHGEARAKPLENRDGDYLDGRIEGLANAIEALCVTCRIHGAPDDRDEAALEAREINEGHRWVHRYDFEPGAETNVDCAADMILNGLEVEERNRLFQILGPGSETDRG